MTAPPVGDASLKRAAIRSSAWMLSSYAAGQLLRFGSNAVFTYLLAEEAFGVMMIVNAIVQGLQMFSDIGLGPSVVQDKRGDDQRFLNTAFTLQVMRGVFLAILCLALTYPAAAWYSKNDPLAWDLLRLMPVSALAIFIGGFVSTKVYTASRHLSLGRVTLIELASQVLGIATIMIYALIHRDVFALVIGSVVSAIVRVVLSHSILPGHRNRFAWDRDAAKSIVRFGGWIFVSTVATFFAMQLDRLLFPAVFEFAEAGVYSLASSMASMLPLIVGSVQMSVVFPLYSRIMAEGRSVMPYLTRVKGAVFTLAGLLVACAIGGSNAAIELIYDNRWLSAGWMISILLVGVWFQILEAMYCAALLARGQAKWMAFASAAKPIVFVVWFLSASGEGGLRDAIIAWSLADIARGLMSMLGAYKQGVLTIWLDVGFTCWTFLVAGGLWLGAHTLSDDYGVAPVWVLVAVAIGGLLAFAPLLVRAIATLRKPREAASS